MSALEELLNIGSKSAAWLYAVGVYTRADIERLGPAAVYQRVKDQGYKPSLNLLYALAGAVMDVRWNQLPDEVRGRLLLELDALEDQRKRDQF